MGSKKIYTKRILVSTVVHFVFLSASANMFCLDNLEIVHHLFHTKHKRIGHSMNVKGNQIQIMVIY